MMATREGNLLLYESLWRGEHQLQLWSQEDGRTLNLFRMPREENSLTLLRERNVPL